MYVGAQYILVRDTQFAADSTTSRRRFYEYEMVEERG